MPLNSKIFIYTGSRTQDLSATEASITTKLHALSQKSMGQIDNLVYFRKRQTTVHESSPWALEARKSPWIWPKHERAKEVVFLFFIFIFYKKYIFDLEIYRNIPRPPRCRDLAARQRGGRGFCAKPFAQIIARRSLGPVARQRGGRPPGPPGCGATGSPTHI